MSKLLLEQIKILQEKYNQQVEAENEDFLNQIVEPVPIIQDNSAFERLNQAMKRFDTNIKDYYVKKQQYERLAGIWNLNFHKEKDRTQKSSRSTIISDRDIDDFVPNEISAYDTFIDWTIGKRQRKQFKKLSKNLNCNDFLASVSIKTSTRTMLKEVEAELRKYDRQTVYRFKASKLTRKNFSELFPLLLKQTLYNAYSKNLYYHIKIGTLVLEFHNIRVNNYATLKINKFRYNYQKGDLIKCEDNCLKNFLIEKGIKVPKNKCKDGMTIFEAMDYADKYKTRINFILEDNKVITSTKKINYTNEITLYVVDDHIEYANKGLIKPKIQIIDEDDEEIVGTSHLMKWLDAGIVPIIENANLVNGQINILSFKVNDVIYKTQPNKIVKLVKKYKEIQKSYYNLEAYAMVSDINAFGIHKTLVPPPSTGVLYSIDFIKSYTNIAKDIEIPVYSIFDEIVNCSEINENGLYRISSITEKSELLCMEIGKFYPKTLVEYAGCNVSMKYIPSKWFKMSHKFIAAATGCTLNNNIYNSTHKNFDFNKYIGQTNLQNKSYVNARIQRHHTGIDNEYISYLGNDWFVIGTESKELDNSNYRMVYNFISFEQSRRLGLLIDHLKSESCNIIELRADCVIYEGQHSNYPGTKCELFEGELIQHNQYTVINKSGQFNKFPCYNDSYFIWGPAGTGKTTKINELVKTLDKPYLKTAPTNAAAAEIDGVTIDSLFYRDGALKYNDLKGYDMLIIDEIGMVSEEIYNILLKLKLNRPDFIFIFVGDPINQLLARGIEEIANKTFFSELINTNLSYKLEKCYRFAGAWDDYELIQLNSDTMINIAYTNKKCKEINDKLFKIYGYSRLIAKKTVKSMNIYKSQIYSSPEVVYDPDIFDLGYCITVHKAQGKTFNELYTIHEFDLIKDNPRLHYVAVTRRTGKQIAYDS